jgi:hydroxyacylglutathione hydrolase
VYKRQVIGRLKVYLYPCKGHSLGGMFVNINNVVFTGDEFIFESKTVTKLPGGNLSEVFKSYNFLKSKFDNETILYPGHGKQFYIEELKIW